MSRLQSPFLFSPPDKTQSHERFIFASLRLNATENSEIVPSLQKQMISMEKTGFHDLCTSLEQWLTLE